MPENADEPFSFDIVDAHHHLWDLAAVHYPWLMAKGVTRFFGDPAPIQTNYLAEHFQVDIGNLPVTQSVHVQVGAAPGANLCEAQWVQHSAERNAFPTVMVAYCPLEQPGCDEQLDQLQVFDALRGVRQIIGRHPQEDAVTGTDALLSNPQWTRGLRALAARGLSFDLQLIPEQMAAAYELLAEIPQLRVALCHCGSPWYQSGAGFAMWEAGLRKLASLPNVWCKISGLGMFDRNWTSASVRPIFATVLDAFGVERCMFGSNFPVDKLYASYAHVWQSYAQLCTDLSAQQQRLLFGANCQEFYRF